jgi:hypothetical protein
MQGEEALSMLLLNSMCGVYLYADDKWYPRLLVRHNCWFDMRLK